MRYTVELLVEQDDRLEFMLPHGSQMVRLKSLVHGSRNWRARRKNVTNVPPRAAADKSGIRNVSMMAHDKTHWFSPRLVIA